MDELMPNPQAAKLIADNLHELTADDGTVLRDNMLTPSKAMPQDWHDGVATIKQGRAEGIVKLIEDAGGQVVMPGDSAPAQPPPPQWVDVNCTACGNRLFQVNLLAPGVRGRYFIEGVQALDPECPHHVQATRQ